MRFNEKELRTLAAQHKCEKEGNLFFRERQEGFFKKAEGENFLLTAINCVPLSEKTIKNDMKTC